jgi:hypothetical protein
VDGWIELSVAEHHCQTKQLPDDKDWKIELVWRLSSDFICVMIVKRNKHGVFLKSILIQIHGINNKTLKSLFYNIYI